MHEYQLPIVRELPNRTAKHDAQTGDPFYSSLQLQHLARGSEDPRKRGLQPEHARASDEQLQHTLSRIAVGHAFNTATDRHDVDHRHN